MPSENTARNTIATRLRLARDMAGLSQGQVAKKLGLHRPSVSEMEAGRRAVTADELVTLADLYGVSVAWLTRDPEEKINIAQERIELAARELSKLKPKDVDRLLQLLTAFRNREQHK